MILITCSNAPDELQPYRLYAGIYAMLAHLNGLTDADYRSCDHQFGVVFRVLKHALGESYRVECIPETAEELDKLDSAFELYREVQATDHRSRDLALTITLRVARIAGSDLHLALSYGARHITPHLDDYVASERRGRFSDVFLDGMTRSQRHPTLMVPAFNRTDDEGANT